jgi:hypothetical protein
MFISWVRIASVISDHIRLRDGDIMEVAVEGFGRPLRNPVRENKTPPVLTGAIALR